MIHLDTGFLIRALVPGTEEDRAFRTWLRDGVPVRISAVAWAEFRCGPLTGDQLGDIQGLLGASVAFDAEDAELAASLFNDSGRRRGSLADCMIAAAALRADAAVATSNVDDFAAFAEAGLRLAPSAW